MTQEERNPYKTRKQVEIGNDDLEWFYKTHGKAQLSWIVNLLFNSYRLVCEEKPMLPLDAAMAAAVRTKEEVEEDGSE